MCFSYFLFNLNIQVYFSIFFQCGWVLLILFIFSFCFGLLSIGQRYLCSLLCLSPWWMFNLIMYMWCMHPYWFSSYYASEGDCGFVLYAQILSFIFFIANLKFRPEVIIIKLEQTNHRPQLPAVLMHVMPKRTKAIHKLITSNVRCSADDQMWI